MLDVIVCEEWHNYQNFAEWFNKNYISGYELDKDLLSNNDKIYSPCTCVFIPKLLNKFMANLYSTNNTGFIGVTKESDKNKYRARINDADGNTKHIGYFVKASDAGEAYLKERETISNEWKKKMKGILSDMALRNIE